MNIGQMNNYKRHPQGLDLMQLPQPILERYSVFCEYKYIEIDDYNEIPVPLFALLGLERTKIDIAEIPLMDYAKGFIEGYNSNLVPFIDTPESRKEIVLKEAIFKGGKGFCEYHTENGSEYRSADMFESGLFEGKRYKAWEILFQTPNAFIEWFLPNQKTKYNEKIIEPFHTHLNHSLREQLAEICKTIFNRNKSPKDYAIMLCLLSESGIVLIPNRKRTSFYLSWYSFIDEPSPTRNNFYGINKNIVDKSGSGFVFHDEDDQDYCHLRSTFEEALKSIK